MQYKDFKKISYSEWKELGGFSNDNLFRKSKGIYGYSYFKYV